MATTKKNKNKVARYVVKANGRVVDWSFSKDKANEIAFRFEYECMNRDESFKPKMEIIEEVM